MLKFITNLHANRFPLTTWSERGAAQRFRLGLSMLTAIWLVMPSEAHAQHIHRNNFENNKTFWIKGPSDAHHDVTLHASTDQGAHNGQRSEYIMVKTQAGTFLYYQYQLGKAPIIDELNGGLWLKANRPGVQLLARVVLPQERDPKNLESPLTTLIKGDQYQNAGRWQRLSLGRPMQLTKQQQQLLQAEMKRPVNFNDAFIDSLILNVYSGPGPTELWIDDLEVGPVLQDPLPPSPPIGPAPATVRPGPGATPIGKGVRPPVEFNGTHLLVGNKPFLIRGIRVTDTPIKVLHAAGFNTVFLEANADPRLMKEAAELGMWIVPHLPVLSEDPRYSTAEGLTREVQRLAEQEGLLFWHMGRTLSYEQSGTVTRAAQVIRQADPGRPVGADVWDGLLANSRALNLVAVHRWPLMTSLELPRYRDWTEMRRRLMSPGAFTWTWIQTHVPEWNMHLLHGQGGLPNDREPIGPQPEQIRLLTYGAIAGGAKGIAFWSDRFLADSHHGRDRLLECGLLNMELEMLEPILAGVDDMPQWIATSNKDVKAAVLRSNKGILVLPMWQGKGAQFVPGQAAVRGLSIVVPQIPASMQAWEVLPGDVKGLRAERVVGGTRVTLPEFGLTSAIMFTSDVQMVVRFQEFSRARRQQAAQWTYDMAAYSLEKAALVNEELNKAGHVLHDGSHLMSDARARLDNAKRLWDTKLYSEAYREAQRALRPTRIVMRAQWDEAVKELDAPVASPQAVSYFTLPRHWQFMKEVKASHIGANVLPGGDFEAVPVNPQEAWKIEEPTLDEVEMTAIRVTDVQGPVEVKKDGVPSSLDGPKEGKQCALLQIRPKNRQSPPLALERTLLALTSPAVKLPPGTLVQVSCWVRIPEPISASVDGALFYDSAAGEPFAVRLSEAMSWKKVTLYRRVPASGQVQVTLALTGLGAVYFDDVRIEPLTATPTVPGNLVSNPR